MTALLLPEPTIQRDADSVLRIKANSFAALRQGWCNYQAGDVFRVIKLIPCTGGQCLRYNARCVDVDVYESGQTDDVFFHRTLPAEYLQWVPGTGEQFQVDRNQGMRDAQCLSRIGNQALCDYEMPNGRVYLFIMDGLGERSVSRKQLPRKWNESLDDTTGTN